MEWNSSLEIGIKKIDDQHKELISRINGFLTACMQQKGRDAIVSTLDFLNEYVITHFSDEEQLQKSSNYPKAIQHKVFHDTLIAQLKPLRGKLMSDGVTLDILISTGKMLTDWLIQHINKEDKDFAAFYNAN